MNIEDLLKIKEESDALTTRAMIIVQKVMSMSATEDQDEIMHMVELTNEMETIADRLVELRDAAVLYQRQAEGTNIIPFPTKTQ